MKLYSGVANISHITDHLPADEVYGEFDVERKAGLACALFSKRVTVAQWHGTLAFDFVLEAVVVCMLTAMQVRPCICAQDVWQLWLSAHCVGTEMAMHPDPDELCACR